MNTVCLSQQRSNVSMTPGARHHWEQLQMRTIKETGSDSRLARGWFGRTHQALVLLKKGGPNNIRYRKRFCVAAEPVDALDNGSIIVAKCKVSYHKSLSDPLSFFERPQALSKYTENICGSHRASALQLGACPSYLAYAHGRPQKLVCCKRCFVAWIPIQFLQANKKLQGTSLAEKCNHEVARDA